MEIMRQKIDFARDFPLPLFSSFKSGKMSWLSILFQRPKKNFVDWRQEEMRKERKEILAASEENLDRISRLSSRLPFKVDFPSLPHYKTSLMTHCELSKLPIEMYNILFLPFEFSGGLKSHSVTQELRLVRLDHYRICTTAITSRNRPISTCLSPSILWYSIDLGKYFLRPRWF